MHLPTKPLSLDLPFSRRFQRGRNFRTRKRIFVEWRQATPDEYAWLKTQPALEQLGDFLFLAPAIDDELWLLIERVWNGWPDPPTYGFMAYDLEGQLLTGVDFDRLPRKWQLPEPLAV